MISVIVPVYNGEEYLSNCIESILGQTYKDLEIVLINDGSTDDSSKICRSYQTDYPDRIRLFETENRGVLQARLTGIRQAKGEWSGFVDGDDEIGQDFYERLLRNAETHHASISHCGYQTIVNGGERIHRFYGTGKILLQDHESALRDLLIGDQIEPGIWNKLFSRSLFVDSVLQFLDKQHFRFYEDFLMNFCIFNEANCSVYEDFCGYHYLAHDSSASRSAFRPERLLEPIEVLDLLMSQMESTLLPYCWRDYLLHCMGAYEGLYGRPEYSEKTMKLRQIILQNEKHWAALSRNERVKLRVLLVSPHAYRIMVRLYRRFVASKTYE